jgi:3-oxoacyl-(acyl-carrier-protein) synthase
LILRGYQLMCIMSTSWNNDPTHASPPRLEGCAEEPARAIGICLKEGGIAPTDVQYIHHHRTSTETQRPDRDACRETGFRELQLQAAGLVAEGHDRP